MQFDKILKLKKSGATCLRGLVGTLGLLSAMLAGFASAAPVLSVTSSPNGSSGPGTVMVFVNAEQVTDLYAFQFTLTFDSAVLSAQTVTEGAFMGLGGTTFFDGGTIDNASGLVSFVFGSLIGPVAGVDGTGVLASFSFNVLESAITAVELADVLVLNSALDPIELTVQGAAIAVPEPPTWMLLGLALVSAAAIGRRRGTHRNRAG